MFILCGVGWKNYCFIDCGWEIWWGYVEWVKGVCSIELGYFLFGNEVIVCVNCGDSW